MNSLHATHATDEELTLLYYGEARDEAENAVEAHLAVCETCRASYQSLQRVLNTVDSMPVPERSADYEQQVWSLLAHRIPAHRALSHGWRWRHIIATACVAAAVIAAFLAGRFWREPAPTQVTLETATGVHERVLMLAIADHLDRSQAMLVQLDHAAPAGGRLDISEARRVAEDLVDANRLYRQTAIAAGDTRTALVLDDLERALLEIAHSPSTLSTADWRALRDRMEERSLRFKVKAFNSQIERSAEGADGSKL